MAFYFVGDNFLSPSYLASFLVMAFAVWLGLRFFFHIHNFKSAILVTVIAMVFLPFVMGATEGLNALIIIAVLGALMAQYIFRGFRLSWPEAMMVFVMALVITGWLTPML